MKSTKVPYTTISTYTLDSQTIEDYFTNMEQTKKNTIKRQSTPSYYQGAYKSIEAFDVVMDFQRNSYNIGVAIAYLLRAGKKKDNPIKQDLKKAVDHLLKEIEYLEYEEQCNIGAEAPKDHLSK